MADLYNQQQVAINFKSDMIQSSKVTITGKSNLNTKQMSSFLPDHYVDVENCQFNTNRTVQIILSETFLSSPPKPEVKY